MGSDRPFAPLLAAKQAIPILRGGTIHRDRLESQLRTADTPLTLVVAPAGWGKTTLLSSWARGDPEVRVAWVSLDENDDEPMRFWRYVLSALQASSDAISLAPLDALLTPGLGPLDLAVPLLLNELAATSIAHAIVLDDFHLLANRSLHEEVEYLLAYLPPPARLIVGSRQDPPLPIARLRARGQLTELRADDLRFEPAEAQAMVTELVGADIGPSAATSAWTQPRVGRPRLQLHSRWQRTRARPDSAGVPTIDTCSTTRGRDAAGLAADGAISCWARRPGEPVSPVPPLLPDAAALRHSQIPPPAGSTGRRGACSSSPWTRRRV